MTSFIRNVAFDAPDAYALAQFWSGVVGLPIHPECAPGDDEVVIDQPGGPRLFFQTVPESKTTKNHVHVCLQPSDATRDKELDRVLALGATIQSDHRTPDGGGWLVLLDPAGNEFCLTRSESERH